MLFPGFVYCGWTKSCTSWWCMPKLTGGPSIPSGEGVRPPVVSLVPPKHKSTVETPALNAHTHTRGLKQPTISSWLSFLLSPPLVLAVSGRLLARRREMKQHDFAQLKIMG